jgi:hypothetical protein
MSGSRHWLCRRRRPRGQALTGLTTPAPGSGSSPTLPGRERQSVDPATTGPQAVVQPRPRRSGQGAIPAGRSFMVLYLVRHAMPEVDPARPPQLADVLPAWALLIASDEPKAWQTLDPLGEREAHRDRRLAEVRRSEEFRDDLAPASVLRLRSGHRRLGAPGRRGAKVHRSSGRRRSASRRPRRRSRQSRHGDDRLADSGRDAGGSRLVLGGSAVPGPFRRRFADRHSGQAPAGPACWRTRSGER